MYLERLEIQGFKSFANSSELVFNRELTSIVGPNGSGKSNIADAIRWVLGEQSVKLLRGKRSDDVIFSGSDKKARLGFAQVDMYLDNSDHRAPIDYEKIVISRKIYRDGESEYLLNNTKVRLTDIQILLAKSRIGQKSYSVIGQGTVDHLLTLSAQERKDFFDEATGVKQYQMKKEQAIHKLLATHENLIQGEQVLQEITPRLRSLSRQVKRLEIKEELEKNLHESQTHYYSYLQNTLQTELTGVRKDKTEQEQKLNKAKVAMEELQTKLEHQGGGPSRSEEFDLLQRKLTALQDEYNLLSREKTRLEGSRDLELMKSGQSDLVWLQGRLDVLKNKRQKLEIQLTEGESSQRSHQKQRESLERRWQELTTAWKKTENLLSQQSSPERQVTELVEEATYLEQEIDRLHHLVTGGDNWSDLQRGWNSFSQRLRKLIASIRHKPTASQHELMTEFQKLSHDRDSLQAELQTIRLDEQKQIHEVESLHRQLKEIQEEKTKLQSQMNSQGSGDVDGKQLQIIRQKQLALEQQIEILNKQLAEFHSLEEGKKQQILEWQKSYSRLQYDFNLLSNEINKYNVELAKLETRNEDLQREIGEEFPNFRTIKVAQLQAEEVRAKILDLKRQLAIVGAIDDSTLQEYQEVKERHDFLTQQTSDLNEAIGSLKKLIKELDETIAKQFNENFVHINSYFNKYFKKLFNGGTAKLILEMKQPAGDENLVNEDDEDDNDDEEEIEDRSLKFESLEYGIEIVATPPGKKLSGINMLSGGEKALTAIALISAIIANNPSPFVMLDEVDAALDEANSIRFADIISELSDKTQFIAVTHNRATMHNAKILYGVTMGDDGISRLLSVNFSEADQIAA